MIGNTNNIIQEYHKSIAKSGDFLLSELTDRRGNRNLKFLDFRFNQNNINIENKIESLANLTITLNFELNKNIKIDELQIAIGINDMYDQRIADLIKDVTKNEYCSNDFNTITFEIANFSLAPGNYNCNLFSRVNGEISDWLINIMNFTIIEKDYFNSGRIITSNSAKILLQFESKIS